MEFGVALKRHGAELIGTCLLHDDKATWLVVSLDVRFERRPL